MLVFWNMIFFSLNPVDQRGIRMVTKQIGFNYKKHFRRDPKICGGQLIIKGTRIPVRTILASLAEGGSVEEILVDFPTLKEADVKAVIAFAAASVQEDLPISELPCSLMKIKLDENIPHRLTELLERMGHDVDTVFDEV